MNRRDFVIAIDFGTTFSSVAWSLGGDQAVLVRHWPGTRLAYDAVPSIVYYGRDGEMVGWGYQDHDAVKPPGHCSDSTLRSGYLKAEWFKLRLSSAVDQTMLPPLPAGRTAPTVVVDYLHALREHCEKDILESVPRHTLLSHADNIQYVLTVPAIWDLAARDLMRQCMMHAGYRIHSPDQLLLISEPEAAAMHYAVGRRQNFNWRIGDNVLIIDAGGGTVDLVTYVLTSQQPCQVSEIVQGTGGFSGGTFVDNRFRDLACNKLINLPLDFRPRFLQIVDTLLASWTTTWKMEFGNSKAGMAITIDTGLGRNTSIPECDILLGHMSFSEPELLAVFKPVCDEIIELVAAQLSSLSEALNGQQHVVFLLLVGGFGRSSFLRNTIRASIPAKVRENMGQFADAWTAVVQGALLSTIERMQGIDTVIGHVARQHFLLSSIRPACSTDDPAKCFPHPLTGRKMVPDIVIVIKKGENLSSSQTFQQQLFRSVSEHDTKVFQTTLYACESEQAPTCLDDRCVAVCEMLTDLRGVPLSGFVKRNAAPSLFVGATPFYEIHFTLCIRVGDGNLDLELIFNGRSYGKQRAVFEQK